MAVRHLAFTAFFWSLVAAAVTWPLILDPFGRLLGDPDVDVWNHAWGYWFVAEALARGELPFFTLWSGAPEGGTLWFIDAVGAFAAVPLTLVFGAGVSYNLVMFLRVAFAGFAAAGLCEALSGKGPHTRLAGVAYASSPFLVSELGNGISEVCAVAGVPLSLWALISLFSRARAGEARVRDYVLVGLSSGFAAAATPYYGLVVGSLGLVLVFREFRLLDPRRSTGRRVWIGLAAAGVLAASLALPPLLAFRASLYAPDALIERTGPPKLSLLAHNAVDPREYLNPREVRSVDLKEKYKESFIHTGYVRWSVLLLCVIALIRRPELRFWAIPAGVAALMGLGTFLWWGQDWVRLGGNLISLPFWWAIKVFPGLAITHPLRLSLGLQAVLTALAGAALAGVGPPRWRPLLVGVLALGVAAETAVAGGAVWPIRTSEAAIPGAYEGLPEGVVLDLPTLVGETMAMQRYFWYQTGHRHPLPYPPDIRVNRPRDVATMWYFSRFCTVMSNGGRAEDLPIPDSLRSHLRQRYVAVLVHEALEAQAGMRGAHRTVLERALGAPEEKDGVLVWRLR